jgi:hypothetical protein
MRRPVSRLPVTAAFFLGSFLPADSGAQTVQAPSPEEMEAARSAPLFLSHELLELTIEADFKSLTDNDRREDSEERPARISWNTPGGEAGSQDLQIRTRGNFRLVKRNCSFPPLRLNLKKKTTEGTLFEGQDKLKLVSVCKTRQDYWEQYVLLEYLAYRTLNVLTDLSFRVRLARVTYVDTSGDDDPFTKFGFLIEDDSDLGHRAGGQKQDWQGGQLDPRRVDPEHAILVDLFQYMIGNTDWSAAEMHNMELVLLPDGTPFTIPFDFDFSGLVNARYASPDPSLDIRRVRQRLFRGFCPDQVGRNPDSYESVYQLFRDKKDQIYEVVRSLEGLDDGRRDNALDYFDDFYETLNDPGKIESRLMRRCRPLF